MTRLFENKIAVVTGAGGTLCSEIAIQLALEGAKVFLVGRTAEKLIVTAEKITAKGGVPAEIFACDVTDRESVAALAKKVEEAGGCDYLVNGAGGNNVKAMPTITKYDPRELTGELPEGQRGLYDIDMDAFESVLNINTMGTVYPTMEFAKQMIKKGGGVIWGGIRNVEQMKQVPDVQVYYRGIDPTPIREFVMKDFNGITRIGKATVLPGDIVYGAGGGVLFIPSHLVQEVVEGAAKTHVKDDFGFEMIAANKFTTAQIDRATWTEEMLDMLTNWIQTDPRGEKYRDLDWSHEYDLARNGDPDDTQTML